MCVVIDADAALEQGHEFWIARSNAVITRTPVETELVIYILDNKMDDPMADPLFARPVWHFKQKKKADTVPGGTPAAEKDQAQSSTWTAPAKGEDWDAWSSWKDPTPAAAAAAAEPDSDVDQKESE